MPSSTENLFESIVGEVYGIGVDFYKDQLRDHAQNNFENGQESIKKLPSLEDKKSQSAIVISAGPSVHKKETIKKIKKAKYEGTVITVDGTYIACIKQGLIPDFVVTLDPNPTRIVRWFGDPDFEEHSSKDDYFARQDLDIEFRKNSIEQNKLHIELVNTYGHLTKAIVASCAPKNVVQRINEAKMNAYWWNPLVDDPRRDGSTTREIYDINKFPCMNTGGTVGTAAWVFAYSILRIPHIAVTGMDLGYYHDTPLTKTQTYYELISHLGSAEEIEKCFVEFIFPLTGEKFYTDPTYFWYRKNFLELLERAQCQTYNCTEGGTLFGEGVECTSLEKFLETYK